jgi:hypothetical protein
MEKIHYEMITKLDEIHQQKEVLTHKIMKKEEDFETTMIAMR